MPRLVRAGRRDAAAAVAEFFNVTLGLYAAATLMQIGLACLAIYFIGGRRRVYLWFGIQAVTATSYPLLTHGALGVLAGHLDISLAATALVIAIWVSLHFSYDISSTGFLFVVMELVTGRPLSDLHAQYGDVRWAVAL